MGGRRLKILALVLMGAILIMVPGLLGCGGDEPELEELRISDTLLFPAEQYPAEQLEVLDEAYKALSEEQRAQVDEMVTGSIGCLACEIGVGPVAIALSGMSQLAVLQVKASSEVVKDFVKLLNALGIKVEASAVVKFLHDTVAKAIAYLICKWAGAC
jgi:hypothetical protein